MFCIDRNDKLIDLINHFNNTTYIVVNYDHEFGQ